VSARHPGEGRLVREYLKMAPLQFHALLKPPSCLLCVLLAFDGT
jgi:hypothetical protein